MELAALSDPLTLAMLAGVALLAGFIDAVAGGGGLLVMPTLLSIGMPPHLVLGTNKLISTFGTLSASLAFIRKGLFVPRIWVAAILGTGAGAALGAALAYQLSAETLKTLLPLAILAAALYLVLPRRTPATDPIAQHCPDRLVQGASGSVVGFYDGFIGPGTGAFWMAVGLRLFRQDIVRAAGVARFMNFTSNATSLLTFLALGQVDFRVGLAMGATLMCGALIGAHSAIRYGSPLIRPVFTVVVVLMAGRLLAHQFFGA